MNKRNLISLHVKLFWCTLITLLFIGTAQAQVWSCIHGQDGNIEYINRVDTMDRVHIGWGLDFNQKSGLKNWIHFAVPSVHGQSSQYVALQFYSGSSDAIVDKVHVYNLGTKVVEIEDLGWSDGWYTEVIDLGSKIPFTALGISVEVGAGVEMMSHQFIFTGACAFLEP